MVPAAIMGDACPSPTSTFHFSLRAAGQDLGSTLRSPSRCGPRHSVQSAAERKTLEINKSERRIKVIGVASTPPSVYRPEPLSQLVPGFRSAKEIRDSAPPRYRV